MGNHHQLHRALTLLLLPVVACSIFPSEEKSHCDASAAGTRADLTIPVGAATRPVIDEPVVCGWSAPKRITVHAFGKRHFVDAAGESVCTAPGDSSCRYVLRTSFRAALLTALAGQHSGVSPECDYILSIAHWSDANTAVTLIDAELERWDVADNVDLAIEPPGCVVAEDSAT